MPFQALMRAHLHAKQCANVTPNMKRNDQLRFHRQVVVHMVVRPRTCPFSIVKPARPQKSRKTGFVDGDLAARRGIFSPRPGARQMVAARALTAGRPRRMAIFSVGARSMAQCLARSGILREAFGCRRSLWTLRSELAVRTPAPVLRPAAGGHEGRQSPRAMPPGQGSTPRGMPQGAPRHARACHNLARVMPNACKIW